MGSTIMKKTSIFLILLTLLPASLFAGRQEGILQQFRQAEEALRAKNTSAEARLKTLENNLMRGLKQTILRQFYSRQEEYLKELNPQTMAYENPTSPLVYYVKYKDMIVRFDFASDPERFTQAPVLKKVLILDEETQKLVEQNAAAGGQGGASGGQQAQPQGQ